MFKEDLTKFKNIRHGSCFYDSDGYMHAKVKEPPSLKIKTEINAVCLENSYLCIFDDEDDVYSVKGSTLKNP